MKPATLREWFDVHNLFVRYTTALDVCGTESVVHCCTDDGRLDSPVHSAGVVATRSQYLAGVTDQLYEYGRIQNRDVRLVVSEGFAIQDGIAGMMASAHGAGEMLIRLIFCFVRRREDAQRRLLYRQATRMP
jgi:hypothetical protein